MLMISDAYTVYMYVFFLGHIGHFTLNEKDHSWLQDVIGVAPRVIWPGQQNMEG